MNSRKQNGFKVGDEVFVTKEGARAVGFGEDISRIYTIDSFDDSGKVNCMVRFKETRQVALSNGIIMATELTKALL